MADFVMPKLGPDMTSGILVAWHTKPGDRVKRGDVVAEIETDKGVIDVEVFSSGVLEKLVVQPGEKVPVGTVLATLREDGGITMPQASAAAAATTPLSTTPQVSPSQAAADLSKLRISPSARELARKLGVDPSRVQGTGPSGAITRDDIERAAKQPQKPAARGFDAVRMRQAIAAAMSRSKREIPHYYLSTTIDLGRALDWLTAANEKRLVTERLLPGVLLLKAVALALHDTDKLSLDELMQKLREVVQRTRTGALRGSEFTDPTITVTSLGERGVEAVFPIIYPPQVAIVGFGKVGPRPWVVDSQVVARPLVTATLGADHRVSDGHRGGLFLAAIDRLLQEPGKL